MIQVGRRILIALASFLLFFSSLGQPLHADTVLPADTMVGVYPLGQDTGNYRAVIETAVSYKLTGLGLAIVVLPADAGVVDLETRARKDGVPTAVRCRFSTDNGRLHVSFAWHEVGTSKALVERQQDGGLDLRADAIILQALDSLIEAVRPEIDRLAKARAAATRAAQPPSGAQVKAPVIPPAVGPATGTAAANPVSAPPAFSRRLVFSGGFAPFLPFGPASSYFSVGLLPSLQAGIQFQTAAGRFSVGIYAAMNAFSASGLIDTASNYLIPVGPDLRYEIGNGRPFVVYAHLSGGPAFLLMNTGSQGSLFDITEFVKSGLGLGLMVTSYFGISIEANYEVYFEMPYLIMGFSPAALLTFFP